MLRLLRKLWPFRRKRPPTDMLSPSVRIVEVDIAPRAIPEYPFTTGILGVVGPAGGQEAIYIGPSIARPLWWQPWRWYLKPRYRQECREALAKFREVFGYPADGKVG